MGWGGIHRRCGRGMGTRVGWWRREGGLGLGSGWRLGRCNLYEGDVGSCVVYSSRCVEERGRGESEKERLRERVVGCEGGRRTTRGCGEEGGLDRKN